MSSFGQAECWGGWRDRGGSLNLGCLDMASSLKAGSLLGSSLVRAPYYIGDLKGT